MEELRTETTETETEIVKTHCYKNGRIGISRIPKRSPEQQRSYENGLKGAMANMGIAVMNTKEEKRKEKHR